MTRTLPIWLLCLILSAGCARRPVSPGLPSAKAFGAVIVEVSGSKQAAGIGTALDQPVVVQVNDTQGAAVAGALVQIRVPQDCTAVPNAGLTGADGQFTTNVTLGGSAGRYQVVASSRDKAGKEIELGLDEIALGYQETLGKQLNDIYCARCHDPESTPARVSNRDNLTAKPHAFTEGAVLNAIRDADLSAVISHGGPALGKSPEMPPYGYTLSNTDIAALASYIRAIADPPPTVKGVVYAKK